ncbi:MAG: DUF47 family protein [Rhodospirillales bacterium]|nr:DUF47 family protein [Rhodospirillales bacterium]
MLMRLFRALMPKEQGFIEFFTAHTDRMVAAADVLAAMMAEGEADRDARFADICRIEGEADKIARDTIIALHRAFMTPFDRSDIHAVITALDDTVDLIEEVAQRSMLYRVNEFSPGMRKLAALIQDCSRRMAEAMPLLNDVSRNVEKINALCERVGKIESEADRVLREALSELIAQHPDTTTFLGRKEVYELLEAVTDRCDDVADLIEGIVLDQV